MKYTDEITDKIYELFASGEHTQKEICEIVGISKQTWNEWKNTKSEFSDLLKRANEERMENMAAMARGGLKVLLTKHTVEEVSREFDNVVNEKGEVEKKLVFERITKKTYMPNVTAVMYALNNADPDNFQHKEHKKVEVEGKIQTGKSIDDMSLEELEEERIRILNMLNASEENTQNNDQAD